MPLSEKEVKEFARTYGCAETDEASEGKLATKGVSVLSVFIAGKDLCFAESAGTDWLPAFQGKVSIEDLQKKQGFLLFADGQKLRVDLRPPTGGRDRVIALLDPDQRPDKVVWTEEVGIRA